MQITTAVAMNAATGVATEKIAIKTICPLLRPSLLPLCASWYPLATWAEMLPVAESQLADRASSSQVEPRNPPAQTH